MYLDTNYFVGSRFVYRVSHRLAQLGITDCSAQQVSKCRFHQLLYQQIDWEPLNSDTRQLRSNRTLQDLYHSNPSSYNLHRLTCIFEIKGFDYHDSAKKLCLSLGKWRATAVEAFLVSDVLRRKAVFMRVHAQPKALPTVYVEQTRLSLLGSPASAVAQLNPFTLKRAKHHQMPDVENIRVLSDVNLIVLCSKSQVGVLNTRSQVLLRLSLSYEVRRRYYRRNLSLDVFEEPLGFNHTHQLWVLNTDSSSLKRVRIRDAEPARREPLPSIRKRSRGCERPSG